MTISQSLSFHHPCHFCSIIQHKFLRGLKAFPAIAEQVYSFRDIEEEPYTICRWLRATKFNADKILERLQDNHALFVEARRHNFYPGT